MISTGCVYSHPKLPAVVVAVLPSTSQICQPFYGLSSGRRKTIYKPAHSCVAASRSTKPLSLFYSVPCASHWRSTARCRADDISFCTATDDDSRYTVFTCALNRTPCRKGLSSLQITSQKTNSYRFFKNKKQVQALEYWLRKNLKNASRIALPSRTFCPLCGVKERKQPPSPTSTGVLISP